ncbi:EscU/YscU/HrcU family type III secretion system export apparatus switch protein [Morganella morganii]|uniref:EscU/YscU/HrcU family type III secretion system export apparatus switch protein n=1 Tax=Morganella morganii TaxID=582 RepID=UPI002495308C|nr:EscU/YscU/HrcU family type III secretion system export apparatus switch protein [Morganella morganii]
MAEKTEKPTSKKLQDESKKGNSFKYKELLSTTGYMTGIVYLLYVADWSAFSHFYQTVLRNVNHLSLPVYIRMLSDIFFSDGITADYIMRRECQLCFPDADPFCYCNGSD